MKATRSRVDVPPGNGPGEPRPPRRVRLRPRRKGLRVAALLSAILLIVLQAQFLNDGAMATSGISNRLGFDTCAAPSKTKMATWWTKSPYFNIGIYIGGANRGCSQPNLTASWVEYVKSDGRRWGLIPIWVGRQMRYPDCQQTNNWGSQISLNTTTAFDQGWDEAEDARIAALNLGMNTIELPIVFDLESYGNGTGSLTTCRNAAKAFIDGWSAYLQAGSPQQAGVYGSQCGSYMSDFRTIPHVPDFIWFAYWNGNPSVYNVAAGCAIPATAWPNDKRHKQYVGDHNETYGGVTIHIDNDCSDGPLYQAFDDFWSNSPCVQ
jgi:hypothetical protein